ncbi:hypothetical protein LOTGIDRAFT_152449 [Lottia gigantea]|uniref:Phorbol-ester/DAG-type domain-containing protein n=1 Tax=Lottia gigantea TaxID=225164 RepID=V4BI40_LOTGI|nr:hypothetical protein LOTGIDRAFT_152449 [Lottia gigantea]ESP05592.1 hypothetical protein LOTGIDRAFT_152449 [Lottia gigantea]
MGSGASTSDPQNGRTDNETKRITLQAKVKAVGMLSKFSKWRQRENDRIELRKQFDQLKKEKKEMYEEIDKIYSEDDDAVRFRRKSTQVPDFGRVTRNSDKPFWAAFESDTKCFLCNQPIEFELGYPCRVCTRIFHKQCLNKSGECRVIDKELCARAKTNTGWSCYICGNLGLLLTDEEMEDLGTKFERFDRNQDSVISLSEYVLSRATEHSDREWKQPDDFDMQRYKLDFRLADIDSNGSLDWWEFINHEAQKILMMRPKDELVELLTEKEVLKAKSLFRTFDKDNKGFITEMGAKTAYRNWYQQIDTNTTGCIFWPQFLDEQALYLLTSRPNQADIFRKSKKLE